MLQDKGLKESEASRFTGFSVFTLQKWRCQGRGPSYLKIGRSIRYLLSDLKKFMAEHKIERQD